MRYASSYQSLKPVIQELLGLSRDAIHIYIGFITFIVTYLFWKNKRNSYLLLLPSFIMAILLELKDNYDGLTYFGRLYISASIHDIINTNIIPVIIFFLMRHRLGNKID